MRKLLFALASNTFYREGEDRTSTQSSKDLAKSILKAGVPGIDELSHSSSSKRSVRSDLDFRQKTIKCIKTIRRYTKDPRVQQNLEVMDQLSKCSLLQFPSNLFLMTPDIF